MIESLPQFTLFAESRIDPNSPRERRWRFVLEGEAGTSRLEIDDLERDCPVERLELLAVLRGLEALDQPSRVTLSTPSRYVSRGLRFGLAQWREADWQWESFGQMQPVKHVDLWRRIDHALSIHSVQLRLRRWDDVHATPPASTANSPAVRRRDREGIVAGRSSWRGRVSGWLQSLGQRLSPHTLPSRG